MAFDKPVRNRGRFDATQPLVAVVGTRRLVKGESVQTGSLSRRAEWWRRGWVKYSKKHEKIAKAPKQAPVEHVGAQGISTEVTPVTAEEGVKGWWTVLYSDGSEKKARRSEVEEMGLLEAENGEEV